MREIARKPRGEERAAKKRENSGRIPLGTMRAKMAVPPENLDPNFSYRWINDNGPRLPQAEKAGYQYVTENVGANSSDIGERISMIVGSKPDGSGAMRAYLMKLPKEFHEEDLQDKRDKINEYDKQIRRTLKGEGMEESYIPGNTSGNYQP